MDRHNNYFVIFPTEEGNENNESLNIHSILQQLLNGMGMPNAARRNNTPGQPQQQDQPDASATPSTTSSNATGTQPQPTNNSQPNRSTHSVSISYIYTNRGPQSATTSNTTDPLSNISAVITSNGAATPSSNNTQTDTNTTANQNQPGISLNIGGNNNNTEGNLNPGLTGLLELVATLAMDALNNPARRNNGINKETFDNFPIRKRDTLTDLNCPICFDEYEDEPTISTEESNDNKRKRNDDDDDHDHERHGHKDRLDSKKSRSTDTIDSDVPSSSTSNTVTPTTDAVTREEHLLNEFRATQLPDVLPSLPTITPQSIPEPTATSEGNVNSNNNATTQTQSEDPEPEPYLHIPVELPCHHIFGRSCLYEWLKSNNSCPLCRETVHQDHSEQQRDQQPTNALSPVFFVWNRGTPIVTNNGTNVPGTPNATTSNETSNATSSPTTGLNNANSATGTPSGRSSPFTDFLRAAHDQARASWGQPPLPPRNTTPQTTAPTNPPRNSFTSNLLRGLGSIGNTDSLFTTGVASRRTSNGVETVNLNGRNPGNITSPVPRNSSPNSPNATNRTTDFFQESARLLQQRMNNNFMQSLLGLEPTVVNRDNASNSSSLVGRGNSNNSNAPNSANNDSLSDNNNNNNNNASSEPSSSNSGNTEDSSSGSNNTIDDS